jgi:hypothetical protein
VIVRRIDIVDYVKKKEKKKKKKKKPERNLAELVRAPTSCLLFMPSWNVFGYGRGGAAFSPGAGQRKRNEKELS